jgi:hypothetical protein
VRASRIASAVAVGAVSLPLLANTTSAVAASARTTPSIGTQLAELKGSDTVAGDSFGGSVAISGTTLVVGHMPTQTTPARFTSSQERRAAGNTPS